MRPPKQNGTTPDRTAELDIHLQISISAQDNALLASAAADRGMTVTDFLLDVGVREARSTLADRTTFVVSEEQFDALLKRFDEPARDNPLLREQVENVRASKWKHLLPESFRPGGEAEGGCSAQLGSGVSAAWFWSTRNRFMTLSQGS